MAITTSDVQAWLLSEATLDDLKLIKDLIAMKQRMALHVGDRVWFDGRTRGIIHGRLMKMNAKSAKVLADSGVTWTVGPSLLQPENKSGD